MQKSSLISLFIFVLGFFVAFIFVLPSWNKAGVLSDEKTLKEKQLTDLHSVVVNIDELSAKYEKSKADLDKLSLAIPSEPQLPELLIQFEDIIKSNGMIINNVEFADEGTSTRGETSIKGSVRIIRVKLATEGSYSNFKNLLNGIEHNIRLMDVTSMGFSRGGADANIKFDVVLDTYYLPSN